MSIEIQRDTHRFSGFILDHEAELLFDQNIPNSLQNIPIVLLPDQRFDPSFQISFFVETVRQDAEMGKIE